MRFAALALLVSCSPAGSISGPTGDQELAPTVKENAPSASLTLFSKYTRTGSRIDQRGTREAGGNSTPTSDRIGVGALSMLLSQGNVRPTFCDTLTFQRNAVGAPIAAGQDLTNAYADAGIIVTALERDAPYAPGLPIAFDSSNPTGGDVDLGTPNECFGGPGVGAGGATNDRALGNLLIKAENTCDANGDGLIDDPDDDGAGAWLVFDFAEEKCVSRADIVDIEDVERPARFRFYGDQDLFLTEIEAGGLGDNSVERVNLDVCGVRKLKVGLVMSGALHDVTVCNEPEPEVQVNFDVDLNNIQAIEFDLAIDLIQGSQAVSVTQTPGSVDPIRLISGGVLSPFPVATNAVVPAGVWDQIHVEMRNIVALANDGSRMNLPGSVVQRIDHVFETHDCGLVEVVADWTIDARIEGDLFGVGVGLSFANTADRFDSTGCPP